MVVMIFVVVATFFSIKYVAAIIILSPVIGKLRDLAPGGNFSTLHDFKMVLGKNETCLLSLVSDLGDWENTHLHTARKLKRMMNGELAGPLSRSATDTEARADLYLIYSLLSLFNITLHFFGGPTPEPRPH